MKTVILNTFDTRGGAARAANRLHKGLQSIGVDSTMLVQSKYGDEPTVIGPLPMLPTGIALMRPLLDSIPLKCYPNRTPFIFSPAILPERLAAKVAALNPEIIHLHWVALGFLKIETLRRFEKPIVWTLHDSWAFTGGCHIPFECMRYRQMCGACPALGSTKENDLSRKIWKRKAKAWKGLNLTVVTPSRWLAECARSSSLFHDVRVEVIPNGLDIQRYKPVDRHVARELLLLPKDKKLILFGAVSSTSDRNKGFHLLLPALKNMADNSWENRAELVVFGATKPVNGPDFGLSTHYLGHFNDKISMNLLYAAVDVFVAPSIQENLPNTVMEALACGTPCVAFNIGGMPDMIEHKKNGYLARPFETDDLARGIEWVLNDDERRKILSLRAREKVEKEFELTLVARWYRKLYEDILRGGNR